MNVGSLREVLRLGLGALLVAVILLVGFVFFELMLNISGFDSTAIGRILGPLLLIAIGVYLLFRRGRGAPGGHSPA